MTPKANIANFQQKFIINVDAKTAKQVPVAQRQILAQAYIKLFSGFAWVNWTQKQSLGRAWQTALGQCASMVATKNKKNPATRYLNNVCDAHKKYWSRIIMLNPNSENTIDKNEDYVKKMRAHGQAMIKQAMDTINIILARYNEYTETIQAKQQEPQNADKQAPEQAKPKQAQKPEQQKPNDVAKQTQQNARNEKPAMQRPQSPWNRALPQRAGMARPAPVRALEKPVVQKQQNMNHKDKFIKGQQKVTMLHVRLRVIRIAKFKQANMMRGFGQQRA